MARLDAEMAGLMDAAFGGDSNIEKLNAAFEGKKAKRSDVRVKTTTKAKAPAPLRSHSNNPRKPKTALLKEIADLPDIKEA